MPKLLAIGFDLDDTLYPERSYALSGFAAVAEWAEARLEIPREEGLAELGGYFEAGMRGRTFNRWLADHGLPADPWVGEMVYRYRQHTPNIAPFAEVIEVLESLRRNWRLAILTQGYAPGQWHKLEALKLEDYFETILVLGEDEREQWKPNRAAFERLLTELNLDGGQVAYVGDNPDKDFYGARQLGMATVRVRRAGGEHARKEPIDASHAPDMEVGDLTGIRKALEPQVRQFR